VTQPVLQEHFTDRIALHQVDRDIFTGWCHSGAPLRAYGGQIAAQSLMAAGRTIADGERRVHSLHGYFLRPGGTKDSITYLVDRLRDGRTFSTRFVRAVQNGETIFMMTASFASRETGPEHQATPPDVGPPDDLGAIFPALASPIAGPSTSPVPTSSTCASSTPTDPSFNRTDASSGSPGCASGEGSRRTGCPMPAR
jgi:acyl-CoA thioesterase